MTTPLSTVAGKINQIAFPRLASTVLNLSETEFRTPKGTARAWFEAHKGQRVDTVQVQPHSVWAPLNRLVHEVRPSRVTFLSGGNLDNVNSVSDPSESSRDFSGCRVLHADDTSLLIGYDFGGPCEALFVVSQ